MEYNADYSWRGPLLIIGFYWRPYGGFFSDWYFKKKESYVLVYQWLHPPTGVRSGINCKLNIMQKEEWILRRIQLFLGVGNVVSKSSGQFSYDVSHEGDIDHIISIFDKCEFVSPHKLHDYTTWKTVFRMIKDGYQWYPSRGDFKIKINHACVWTVILELWNYILRDYTLDADRPRVGNGIVRAFEK